MSAHKIQKKQSKTIDSLFHSENKNLFSAKLLQKSEMRKDIVIELSYKGFG